MKQLILVIEDETNIRKDIVRILSLNNFNTIDTDNGYIAIEIIKEKKPDLIISDIMMPILDGISIFNKISEDEEISSIPFLFLTAKSSKDDIRFGMNIGADDYITKPFDIKDLINAVNSRLKKQEKNLLKINKRYDNLKQSLYNTLPHEIRTPLNTILGYSDYLIKNIETVSKDRTSEMLQDIFADSKRLQRMFENFLFLSKIEYLIANEFEKSKYTSKKTLYSEMLIKDVFFYFTNEYKRNDDIEFDLVDADLLIFDEHFVKIIELLADNCYKFSECNSKVLVKSIKENNQLVILIKDNGIGISEENIQQVSAFKQFDRNANEQQGSGLGLAIVNAILMLYNGRMEINSQINEFTEIKLYLNLIIDQD